MLILRCMSLDYLCWCCTEHLLKANRLSLSSLLESEVKPKLYAERPVSGLLKGLDMLLYVILI